MQWKDLIEIDQINNIKEASGYSVIFKHSTRCSTSAMVLSRLERSWNATEAGDLKPYYLDLIAYRPVSNKIQDDFYVQHESPQALVIKNGHCVYNASHIDISYKEILELAKQ